MTIRVEVVRLGPAEREARIRRLVRLNHDALEGLLAPAGNRAGRGATAAPTAPAKDPAPAR